MGVDPPSPTSQEAITHAASIRSRLKPIPCALVIITVAGIVGLAGLGGNLGWWTSIGIDMIFSSSLIGLSVGLCGAKVIDAIIGVLVKRRKQAPKPQSPSLSNTTISTPDTNQTNIPYTGTVTSNPPPPPTCNNSIFTPPEKQPTDIPSTITLYKRNYQCVKGLSVFQIGQALGSRRGTCTVGINNGLYTIYFCNTAGSVSWSTIRAEQEIQFHVNTFINKRYGLVELEMDKDRQVKCTPFSTS
jgi:hypothetical protein